MNDKPELYNPIQGLERHFQTALLSLLVALSFWTINTTQQSAIKIVKLETQIEQLERHVFRLESALDQERRARE